VRVLLLSLQRLSQAPASAITSEAYGLRSLNVSAPEHFRTLVETYGEVLDLALENRGYRTEHDFSTRLRAIAVRLGAYGAGPRDVVELHTIALRQKIQGAPPQRAQALTEEGRLIVFEVMGHLVSYYRNQPATR
jgi:hypothetical protein